ncbi:MAG: O-antigen ligase family protein [Chitinophagaceae bacterium]|jgi:hypothetical protein|nr:O-antigen ligase family protein [Chitinophagaceae bacterium]
MFELLRREKLSLFWLIFHAGIGFASVSSKWVLIGWFYILLISLIVEVFTRRTEGQMALIYFLGYAMGVEVLARGIKATPFIPDQMGKYLGVAMFGFGLALGGPIKRLSLYGVGMLVLSLPALAIAPEYTRAQIVFNYFGPLALFLGVIFCSRQIMTFVDFRGLVRIIIYSIFALACFAMFKAAEFEKIEYGLTANFESSGGKITNQVATLFGTGICLMLLMFITSQRLFRFKWMDLVVLSFLLVRGLLTFSRGGMGTVLLVVLAIIIFPKAKAVWQDNEIRFRQLRTGPLLIALLILAGSFYLINEYTDNFLLYRYQGKTQRSLQTGFDQSVDIDQVTSGRYTILMSDINMFIGNPAVGVGVGQSPMIRAEYGGPAGTAAHLEMTRLLAEHGIPGLVLVIMIYIYPFAMTGSEPNNYRRLIMLVFIITALSATFHSAMRTMATPLLFAFAFINYVPSNFDWRSALAQTQMQARKVVPRKVGPRRRLGEAAPAPKS